MSFGIGTGALAATGALQLEQSFSTLPLANLGVCLYTLSIRSPTVPYLAIESYTFPLSPQAVRKEPMHMTALHDVAAGSGGGIARLPDFFGQAPPIYTIEGTTGWRSHNSDGFVWSGLASVKRVEALLKKFEDLNQQQIADGNPSLYTMEFYDYFKGDFYQVVPFGTQSFRQTAASPLLSYFSFRFAAIADVSSYVDVVEDTVIAKLFGVGALSALNQVSTMASGFVGDY